MGRKERENFRNDLEDLHRVSARDKAETAAYNAANAKAAKSEAKCGPVDRFIVRNTAEEY